jgi:hypothetical protein
LHVKLNTFLSASDEFYTSESSNGNTLFGGFTNVFHIWIPLYSILVGLGTAVQNEKTWRWMAEQSHGL